jgi:large subunit ribosomal protein L25
MEQRTLSAQVRSERKTGAARRLRRAGRIPAIVYGHRDPVAISLDAHEFEQQIKAPTESQIIRLTVDGESYDVLLKDYDQDILTGRFQHIDFYEIEQGKVLRTHVAIHLEGSAIGAREGGILEQLLHELDIECLPKDIPSSIRVDISHLEVGHSIHVADLVVPDEVKVLTSPDQVVALVAVARVEVEPVEEEVEGEELEEGEEAEAAEEEEAPEEE